MSSDEEKIEQAAQAAREGDLEGAANYIKEAQEPIDAIVSTISISLVIDL